jgi:hypothetical protein
MPRWPLALIAAPAAVAVWSGWVGLGQLCGFGEIHPLPGIWDSARLNTAITLPIGVEAYGAYALAAWLTPGTSERARRFARSSALGSLVLGMLGQVAYHLLSAAHATRAPWPVVMVVACLPVLVLGLGTGLAHLLREPGGKPVTVPATAPESTPGTVTEDVSGEVRDGVPGTVPIIVPVTAPMDVPEDGVPPVPPPVPKAVPAPRAQARARRHAPKTLERVFSAEISRGELPSIRRVKRTMHVGTDRARIIRDELAGVLREVPQAA